MNCSCEICAKQCLYRPGWFAPEEIKKAAKLLKMSPQQFFFGYLGVDWFETDNDPIFILTPAFSFSKGGCEYGAYPIGECKFYEKEKCKIYSARPLECQWYNHFRSQEEVRKKREQIAMLWNTEENQDYIISLLGRKPVFHKLQLIDIMEHFF